MAYRKPQYIVLRMGLIFVLIALFVWSYWQFIQNYRKVELSQKMVEALLENKTEVARGYAQELGLVRENLEQTQAFVNDLQTENIQLKEKVKLLDELKDLEVTIARLRQENTQILDEMQRVKDQQTQQAKLVILRKEGMQFTTPEEGRSVLKNLKNRMHKVKRRIHTLRRQEYRRLEQVQDEIDRMESMAGNNGYVIRRGRPTRMDMPDVTSQQNITIDVKIVP